MRIFCKNNLYKNKKILIYGLGRSGISSRNFLLKHGAKVYIYVDGKRNKKINFDKISMAIISPGINLESEFACCLKRNNIPIISELELGYLNVEGNYIAVTGTNGKTTTVSILYKILKKDNDNTFLAGNIGYPLISLNNLTNVNSNIVCEVSSYQLETCTMFKPKISVILNLAPDHLIRHKNFENYCLIKTKIFKNQTINDYCVLNYDDKYLLKLSKGCLAKKYYFSTISQFENKNFKGAYVDKDEIYFKDGILNEFVMNITSIKLIGQKNLENVLASITISKIMNINNDIIKSVINDFKPLEHRLEIVKTLNNKTYINDSKATNVASTISDVNALRETLILLMVGGSDKGENFELLFKHLPDNVEMVFLYGLTKNKMKKCADIQKYKKYQLCDDLKEAINKANEYSNKYLTNKKVSIVLAPACASFDEFKNFEERGKFFKDYVINGGLN